MDTGTCTLSKILLYPSPTNVMVHLIKTLLSVYKKKAQIFQRSRGGGGAIFCHSQLDLVGYLSQLVGSAQYIEATQRFSLFTN
jgi:hypothetical protein